MTTERDIRNQIAFAKDKGFEEGREEGREEGKTKKQLEIARDMFRDNVDIGFIAKYTKLSEEQIKALK